MKNQRICPTSVADETLNQASSLNLLGTVRTLTMKAFTKEEMGEVLENILTPKDLLRVDEEEPSGD